MHERPLDDRTEFLAQVERRILAQGSDPEFKEQSREWMTASALRQYSYNFSWLGLPIIQYPQDIVALQEIVWAVKPTLIIETGIARGGSAVLSASLLALLDAADSSQGMSSTQGGRRRAVGIDIDLRPWNEEAVRNHPLASYIELVQGSSIDPSVIARVKDSVRPEDTVLLLLDSNHTHDHVLGELEAYAELVTPGSYCVVFDTVIEELPPEAVSHRPWGEGNSPATAVTAFLAQHPEFVVDDAFDGKLMISVALGGFLRRLGTRNRR